MTIELNYNISKNIWVAMLLDAYKVLRGYGATPADALEDLAIELREKYGTKI